MAEMESASIATADAPSAPAGAMHASLAQAASRLQTLYAIPAGILVGVIVFLANLDRNPVPISGDYAAFATLTILLNLPVALLGAGMGFVRGVRAWNARVLPERRLGWGWALLPVSLACAIASTALLFFGLAAFEYAFETLRIDRLQAALLCGAVAAWFSFAIVGVAMQLNTRRLLFLIVALLGMGLYLGAVVASDKEWWTHSFSYLGEVGSNVGYVFNGTLIFVAILVLVWSRYFMNDYRLLVRKGMASAAWERWVQVAIIWIGIAAALVAIFRWQSTPVNSLIHQVAATSMAVVVGGMMAAARWVVPGLPRDFFLLTWVLLAVIVTVHIWAQFGAVNTVGMEFVDFGIGLTWLSQFAANAQIVGKRLEPEAFPF